MGRINKLEESVFNMIAAGEVVERPASVVKELIENSIDAGATSIDIYIEEGGIQKIQVSDNGIGILAEDIKLAFAPHATSKIKQILDLDSVSTLGFRGEALPSIASISEVTMISSTTNDGVANKITLSGGKILSEQTDSRAKGTTVTISNLFFNTPARIKFLKKPSTEQHYIADVVRSAALANPNVQITLANRNEILINSDGGSLLDVIYSVYDASTADSMYEVDFERNGIKVKGYTSKTDFSKPNRTCQTVIINGRCVTDQTVSAAVEKAYMPYLMKRNYPMFVLDIIMPFDDIDVNVHPSKTEVRFRDKQAVFGAVFRAVECAININTLNSGYSQFSENKQNSEEKDVYLQTRLDTASLISGDTYGNANFSNINSLKKLQGQFKETQIAPYTITTDANSEITRAAYDIYSKNKDTYDNYNKNNDDIPITSDITDNINNGFVNNIDYISNSLNKDFTHSLNGGKRVFDGRILGQIFDTYILAERDNNLYFIDQHAAHERILYDNIVDKFTVEYSQPLLIPYKFKLNAAEAEYFELVMPELNKCGFEVEFKFNNYLMHSMPEPVTKMNFNTFLAELFDNRLIDDSFNIKTMLKENICRTACRAAVKGGEALTPEQIEYVIKNLSDDEGRLPTACPHGRPAVIVMTKKDIEKMFKRII